MTGFFARMGERAAGRAAVMRVRPPQPFEGARAVHRAAAVLDLEVRDLVDAAPGAAAGTPPRPADWRAAAPVPPAGSRTAAPAAQPDRRPPTAPAAPTASAAPATPAAGPTPAEPAPAPVRPRPATGPQEPPRAAPPVPRPTPGPAADGAEPRPAIPSEPARAAVPPPSRPERPGVPELPAVDLADLLRTHVLRALVARGLVGRGDRVEVTEAPRPSRGDQAPPVPKRPPRPGTVTVAASPPRRTVGRGPGDPGARPRTAAAGPRAPSGPPEVHVHIDRVVVARAPAARPAEPAPAQRSRPGADHDAYLARRREGG
jgi:hypothetical protein